MSHAFRPYFAVTFWVIASLALLRPLLVSAQTAGPVAAYGFNEGTGATIADTSGNNNTGTINGASWTTQGKYGNALTFNGTSNWVTVNDANSLDLTNGMTLEAWVYPTTTPTNWNTVLMKEQPSNLVYTLYAGSPVNRPNVYFNTSTTTSGEKGFAGPSALALNTWSHLAATYDNSALRLYVNGVQVASQAFTGAIITSSGALRIGGNSVWPEYFQGRIDEVRIYNVALTAAQIVTDMNTPVSSATNTAPTITAIADQVTNEDTATGAIAFTVGDAETAAGSLTVSGSSSNTTLAPNANIVFGSSGASRTVTITPALNQFGTATITVTVSDGQLNTPTSFLLTVNAVNDAPTITAIANQTTSIGTPVGPIAFIIGDAETAAASLTVSGSSSNTTLVPNTNIVFGGSGASRTVTVSPVAGQSGTATITVTISDGLLNTPTNFMLTVSSTSTVSAFPNSATVLTGTLSSGSAASLTSDDNVYFAVASTTSGTRTAAWYGSFTGVSKSLSNLKVNYKGNNSRNCTQSVAIFQWTTSTWAQLDSRTVGTTEVAINNLAPTGTLANYVSGSTASGEVRVRVQCQASQNLTNRGDLMNIVYDAPIVPNTAPTITAIADQVTNEDTATGAIAFTVGDGEMTAGSLTVSGSSSNTTLVPNANIAFGGSGANRTATITPALNQNGNATITVTVSDGQLSTPTSFLLTVNAVNDAPTITNIANQTTTSGTVIGPLGFTVGDVETAVGSLTVSGSSSNTTLVPNAGITFGGSGASRTMTITPAPGQSGTATITATVNDGQASTNTNFLLTVNAMPTGLVAGYSFNDGSGTTVADASGNNNTGIINGATWTTQGRFGYALSFNGASNWITVNDSNSLDLTNAMTLEAWVYPTASLTNWSTIIMKEQPGTLVYALYGGSPSGTPNVYFNTSTTGSDEVGVLGLSALPINTWSHLAGTYDGATIRLYVNGALVASRAFTGSIITSSGALRIGGNSVWPEYFQGRIDEVRVYNRVLTQTEIQTDMNTPVGGASPPTDTNSPTVNITNPVSGATVSGLVTISADAADNVGIASVQFLVVGQPIGNGLTAAPYSVIWDASGTAPGSYSLTAVARDLSNNSTTSAPVLVTVAAPTADLVGKWSEVLSWPLVAVHVNLLADGRVMAWPGQELGYNAQIWNPTTNAFSALPNSTTNLFCSGHCHLPDGRILIAGGHVGAAHVGVRDVNIFNPQTLQWSLVASMQTPRWYPTVTTLGDGRLLVVGGEVNCNDCNALIPEIYSPTNNTWTALNKASLDLPFYPHMFVLPDGRVLAASTAKKPIISRTLDVTAQTWTVVDPNPVDGGSAVMYLPGKVMKAGTSTTTDNPSVPSAATTYVIDMNQPAPAWRETASMAFPRTYHTLTVLPNGTVLVTGGGTTTDPITHSDAVHAAELWSPDTETWTPLATMTAPRLYHSTALLLPDARVVVAGGGQYNTGNDPFNESNAEIFSPPYLFKGARPTITSAPSLITYATNMTVQTPDATQIASVSLIKLGAVTHAFNFDQRYLPLSFTVENGSLSVQTPTNGNLAPPGHYMLFIVNTSSVPSVAQIVKIQ